MGGALRGVAVRVSLLSSYVDGEKERYSLLWSPAEGLSVLLIRNGDQDEAIDGALGLVEVSTGETMEDHTCSLTFKAGAVADRLLDLVETMDALRVEIMDADGEWSVAFDGWVSSFNDRQVSTLQSASRTYTLQARGFRKILEQSWLNWQGKIRAGQSKELFGPGGSLYKKLTEEGNFKHPTWLIETILKDGVDTFLGLFVGGEKVSFGKAFQIGTDGDWATAFDLRQAFARDWYLQAQGPLWGIMEGLAEPDLHEFFLSYRPGPDGPEIPTLIFRPRPWPGGPGDDAAWFALDVLEVGEPGDGFAARDVVLGKTDQAAPNVFSLSSAGGTDQSTADANAKLRAPFLVDRHGIGKRGFHERQVTTSLTPAETATWWDELGPKVLERVAYQEAPLPFLWNLSASYPLLAGARAGSAFQDNTLGFTGYLVSVAHHVAVSGNSISASTSLGVVRGVRGVDSDSYPDVVRRYLNLKKEKWIEPKETNAAVEAAKPTSKESQPAVNGAKDHVEMTKSDHHPEIPNVPTGTSAQELERTKKALAQVKAALAPGKLRVTSGFRSDALNKAVKGKNNSDHKKGLAFDFQMTSGMTTAQAFQALQSAGIPYRQLILETRASDGAQWVHFALFPAGQSGPGQVLTTTV